MFRLPLPAAEVRVLSGGHDYEGLAYRSKTPFIMINLIRLRSINISIEDSTAWVQAGATIGELYYNIAKSDILAFPAGIFPSVGVGGHFSGGGLGTLARKYGLAADHILDAVLVDSKGNILNRGTMGEDLFWAIRGGGASNFGVVIAWKIKLVKVPSMVTVYNLHKYDQEARELTYRWRYVADKLPEDLLTGVIIQNAMKRQSKQKIVQPSFMALYLGGANELIRTLNHGFPELGLEYKDCIEMSWIDSVLYFAGLPRGKQDSLDSLLNRTTLYKMNFKGKSDFAQKPIPKGVWKMISERFLQEENAYMILDAFGGKMNEISESSIPFSHRKGNLYNIQYLVKWKNDGIQEANKHIHWIRMLYDYMTPYVSKSPRAAYLNYKDLDLGTTWGTKYFKKNWERLKRVKRTIDPHNYFRNKQSIPLL